MNIYLRLYYEFFKVGLFAIGGGMATIPFLSDLGKTSGWYTATDLMNMIAVSESTPGPIGINMATYVGFTVGGVPGAVIATIGEVSPAIIIIILIAKLLEKFKESKYVNDAFYGLRPASTALIAAALVEVAREVLFTNGVLSLSALRPKALILIPIVWFLSNRFKPTKDLHPICFVGLCAVIGMIFRFAG